MNFEVRITTAAKKELDAITDGIELKRGIKYADKFTTDFNQQLKRLQDNPYCFAIYYEEPMASLGYRRFLIQKYYRGFYNINDTNRLVTIVHVGHTYQNNQTIFTDS